MSYVTKKYKPEIHKAEQIQHGLMWIMRKYSTFWHNMNLHIILFFCIFFFPVSRKSVIYKSLNHKSGDSVYALKFNNIKVLMWSNDEEAGKRMGRIKVHAFKYMLLFS